MKLAAVFRFDMNTKHTTHQTDNDKDKIYTYMYTDSLSQQQNYKT